MASQNQGEFYSLTRQPLKHSRHHELLTKKEENSQSWPNRGFNPTGALQKEFNTVRIQKRVSDRSRFEPAVYWNNAFSADDSTVIAPINTVDIDEFGVFVNSHSQSVTHSINGRGSRKRPLLNVIRNDLKLAPSGAAELKDKKKRVLQIGESLELSKNEPERDSDLGSEDEDVQLNRYLGSRQKEMPDRQPFFYCRFVTRYPKTSFLLTLSGHIFVALVTVILLFSGYDLFPTEYEVLPMYNWKVPWRKRDFAWRFKDDYDKRYVRKLATQSVPKWYRSMAYGRANIVLYYDAGDGNIFKKETLKQIQKIESEITSLPEYKNFCVQNSTFHCTRPSSIIRLFDGTYAFLNPVFYDPEFSNIPLVLNTAHNDRRMKAELSYFLSKDFSISSTSSHSSLTRSILPIGYPLHIHQEKNDMEEEMKSFLAKTFKPKIEELKNDVNGFSLVYWSFLLFMHDIIKQIVRDLLFALGSVIFIFCFIVYHTKSLWISSLAVLSIATSFLCANMIYRIVLDFRYFGYFHVITLFIILGIGADDLFIFLDVWKNTAFSHYDTLAHRLSEAYKKATLSMFFTSLTTTVAFFTSALSPLLATYSFGVFAGILVIVNYVSVVVFFPCVVVMHHIYFEDKSWKCILTLCNRRGHEQQRKKPVTTGFDNLGADCNQQDNECPQCILDAKSTEKDSIFRSAVGHTKRCDNKETDYGFLSETRRIRFFNRSIACAESGNSPDLHTQNDVNMSNSSHRKDSIPSKPETSASETKKRKVLVRFFRDQYFRFTTHKVIRWIIVAVLLCMVVGFGYSASKLEPDNEQAKLYRSSHNYGKALSYDSHSFIASPLDRNVVVYIVWGLLERDVSGCHFSDPRCTGKERYDARFNPNTPDAQLALKKFCDKLLNFSSQELEDFRVRRDFASGRLEIKCFADSLNKYLNNLSRMSNSSLALPWNYEKTMNFMKVKQDIYTPTRFNKTFQDYLEIPISLWLNDGYTFANVSDFHTYHTLIGEEIGPFSTPVKSDLSVFYGNRIRYLGIQVNLTLGAFTTGYSQGFEVMNRWETFVKEQMKQMPPGMQDGFQLTKDTWHMFALQKTLADNAIAGIVIGVALALPLLILATMNVIVGSIATFCICCSTICVIGVIPLVGWKLGILVSLNMCMLVGLSVDYVVHLAEGYHLSKHTDRLSRVQDMLEEIGISVFSGACTTIGASIFMLFAQIQFFIQFGFFMLCTIGFSLLFSMGLFVALMGIIGPSGDTGDVKVIARKVRDFVTKKMQPDLFSGQTSSLEPVQIQGQEKF